MGAVVMKDANIPRISVVYAAYNESAAIRETIARSVASLRKQFDEFEVLIVDDCGSDGTGKIADELAQEYPNEVRVLHNDRNRGQGAVSCAASARPATSSSFTTPSTIRSTWMICD